MKFPRFAMPFISRIVIAGAGLLWIFNVNVAHSADAEHVGDYTSPNIGKMILVSSGEFLRDGSPLNVSKVSGFWIGQYEITREQFKKITGLPDPSNPRTATSGESTPVQNLTWYQAIVFSNLLSELEGLTPVYSISGKSNPSDWGDISNIDEKKLDRVSVNWAANGYRLPTEMEWLWAAIGADAENRGKTNTNGYMKVFSGQSQSGVIDDYAWCDSNSSGKSHGIGAKRPNELGIYDMTGNVWEWNWDWHGKLPSGTLIDYKGPSNGNERVLHGGSWLNDSGRCNIGFRLGHTPNFNYGNIGLRLVRH